MAITGTWVSESSLLAIIDEPTLASLLDDSTPPSLSDPTAEARLNTIIEMVESAFKGMVNHRYSADIDVGTASPAVSMHLSFLVVAKATKRRRRNDVMSDIGFDVETAGSWLNAVYKGLMTISEWTENSYIETAKARFQPIKDVFSLPEDERLAYEGAEGEHYYDEW